MKPIRLHLLFAGLTFAVLGTAQELHTITLDLATMGQVDLRALEKIKKGDQYQVEVTGVNLNLYKVSVNGKDTTVATAVKFPGFGDFGVEAIASLVGGVGSVVAKVTKVADAMNSDPIALTDETSTVRKLNRLNIKIGNHNANHLLDPLPILNFTDFQEDPIKRALNEYSEFIGDHASQLLEQKTAIDELRLKVELRSLQLKAVTRPGSSNIDYEQTLASILDLRKGLLELQKKATQVQKHHADYVAQADVKKVIDADKEMKALNEKVSDGLAKLSTGATEALSSVDATNSAKLLESLQTLEANESHTYCSAPILYTGGKATLSLAIEPLKPEYNLQTYKTTYTFPLKNRTYVGVSAGFYGAGLYNDAFSTRSETKITATDTSTVYNLVDEHSVRNEIGGTALFTYGTKFQDDGCLGVQFVLGPGISITDKVRPRLLVGGGISLGREHMVLVNGGLVAGYVDRKTAALAEDGPYGGEPGSTTVARLEGSWFVSLGYLFKF